MAPQVELSRVPKPAKEAEVMLEQLEYLVEHVARAGQCGCSDCQRYLRVRSTLLEIFADPPRVNVQQIGPQLVKAA
jgi:hypothetical protein